MDFFPGRSGRGIRVAVIDSGVNTAHPHIGDIASGVTIGAPLKAQRARRAPPDTPETRSRRAPFCANYVEDGFVDILGHGTAVMAAIMEKAPEAKYFAVRIFQTSLHASVDDVVKAIGWCIDHDMHVINLSLGTANASHAARFGPVLARAAERGVILVAAGNALPGSLPGVIGAALDWDCPRESYACWKTAAGIEFRASGYPRPIPGVPRERNLSGMSFAVANLTGFVVRACEGESPSSAQICSALAQEAERINGEPVRARIL